MLFRSSLSDNQSLRFCGRPASASPAAGYAALHKRQQSELVTNAFAKYEAK